MMCFKKTLSVVRASEEDRYFGSEADTGRTGLVL
jgi:hypothetical protein